jgi:hypothetical protein
MHPGDVHRVRVACDPEPLRAMLRGADPARSHAVFFSTRARAGDPRSLADKIAGKDFDGDEFAVIGYQPLVNLFIHQSAPYDPNDASHRRRAAAHQPAQDRTSEASRALAQQASPVSSRMSRARLLEQRLVSNFLMARFLSTSLVGSAGVQWMVFADKHGAAHAKCLAVSPDH